MRAYLDAWKRYFDFSGRSTRAQFWYFQIFTWIALLLASAIDASAGNQPVGPNEPAIVVAVVGLLHIIPGYSVCVRRLHDTNRSGWWILTVVPPLLFIFQKSTLGPNRFGKPIGQAVTVASSGIAVNLEQLEKLSALKASGAITDAEFEKMKAGLV